MKLHTPTIYQEALIEVAKYKQVAEEEAKKAILEAITPLIKKELDRNLAAITEGKLLFEEEDPFATPDPGVPPPDAAGGEVAPPPLPPSDPPPSDPSTAGSTPPIPTSPAGLNVPMPDESGKIVVDFADLFTNTPEGQEPVVTGGAGPGPTEPTTPIGGFPSDGSSPPDQGSAAPPAPPAPAPVPGEGAPPEEEENPFGEPPKAEGLSYAGFKESVNGFQYKVLGTKGPVGKVRKYALEEELFSLFENLSFLKENKLVGDRLMKLQEIRLDHLYRHLQETPVQASIYSENSKDQKMSSNLRAFAKSLFEDASAKGSAGFGDGPTPPKGKEELDPGNAAGKHAMGMFKKPKDPGKKESLSVGSLTEAGEADKLEEELKEMFGEKEDSGNMAEAAEAAPGRKVDDGMDKIKPGAAPDKRQSVAVLEAKKKKAISLKKKMKALQTEAALVSRALRECGMEMEASSPIAEEGAELPIHGSFDIDGSLEMDGFEDMMSGMMDDQDSDMDQAVGGDDDLEIVMDDGSPLDRDGSEDDMTGMMDHGLDSGMKDQFAGSVDDLDDSDEVEEPLSHRKMGEARRRAGQLVSENKKLKNSLVEHEVLTARALCVSKLFVREGLTLSEKKKISEYMDLAQTVAEAKEIYSRVKRILDEKKNNGKRTATGSSSSVVKGGSAASEALNESVEVTSNAPTKSRLMLLAGIKPSSK